MNQEFKTDRNVLNLCQRKGLYASVVCIPTLIFLLEEWSIAEVDDPFTMIFLVEEASISEAALAPPPDICAREVCIFEVTLPPSP